MFVPRPGTNQQGFHLIGGLLLILVLCAVGFVGFWVFKQTNNSGDTNGKNFGPNYNALATCGDKPVLNTLPADLSKLDKIGVLGGINVPDHTLPTDHIYMMYPYGETSLKETYAPADVVVTSIGFGGEYENGSLKNADYTIDMYPCRELGLRFGHMDVLGDKLKAAVGQDFENGVGCTMNNQEYKEIKNCLKNVDLKISAGELLATTNGWDLWATYEGLMSRGVISPEYYHNVDAVCPLDYFTPELKTQLYTKVKRTAEPKCGEAYQDKSSTIQGGWFAHKDPQKAKTDWSSHFSLAHDPEDPNVGMVAVAGTIAEPFMYRFTPAHSGTINREPSETTTGTIYCYEHTGDRRFPNGVIAGPGKVLLKLTNDHQMQIEHKASGTCTANKSFSTPTTYYR